MLGDTFPYRERGRAISTVIGMNTMASIVGVPLAGIVAEATSWRVSLVIVGVLSIVAGILLHRFLRPAQVAINESPLRDPYRPIHPTPPALGRLARSPICSLRWSYHAT